MPTYTPDTEKHYEQAELTDIDTIADDNTAMATDAASASATAAANWHETVNTTPVADPSPVACPAETMPAASMTSAPVSSETADHYTNDNDNKAVAPVTASAAPASEDHNITPPTAPAAIQPDELPQPDVDLAEIPDVTEAEDETARLSILSSTHLRPSQKRATFQTNLTIPPPNCHTSASPQ